MKFLFLCTGNSCRSILSEVLFNHRAPDGYIAYSAGSQPTGRVHPLTLKTLEQLDLSTQGLSSKSMADCAAFAPDVVITVCDQAAQEPCPLYLGDAIKGHWSLSDPSHLILPETEKLNAFQQTVDQINRRLDVLFSANLHQLSPDTQIELIQHIATVE
ncbi:arsenate reductase [Acinetobacter baylyi]|uniref:Arsenate reductase n=1 Tax=Acinetobacter baylyi TaxID=202950 RepID=A0ABU0UZA1_ACIBI|nr:arsenate reductase ArsC [Acinetobacter baylyi]MDQ1209889.1 arsenate reductase [Acinetobacter baylyi]MDR6106514.1 arsenate reductase [Acinetobacter baylyi]MDR6186758.1 arsenate reductase [Acinetobacter baylyi]